MKAKILLLSFLGISILSNAQPLATTFEDAESTGISISKLDDTYPSAAHYEPEKGVFKERQPEFLKSYVNMHQELGKYLTQNGFNWPKTTQLFTRVYFDSSGTIDYFLINPKKANLDEGEIELYFRLLNEFIKDYKLPISASSGFAQCSPIKYVSKKKDN